MPCLMMSHPAILALVFSCHCIVIVKSHQVNPDYKLALKYSILYLEAQRSGKLPQNNRIPWRGDSALDDRGDEGEDLTGGYYDGSDFVKFGYTMAYATTMLAWGVQLYPEVYQSIGEYSAMLEAIKWSTDYFIKCHVSPNEFYGQIGEFESYHTTWGRPEELNETRRAYKVNETHPASDLASEVSAAFSSASIVFEQVNKTYSKELLGQSVELYDFANNFRGLMKHSLPVSRQYRLELHSFEEQLVWAALWLYKATDDLKYLRDATNFFKEFDLDARNSTYFFYNEKLVGIRLLLTNISGSKEDKAYVNHFCDYALYEALKTPKGLLYIRQYGALPLAANIAFICIEAAKLDSPPKATYIDFAKLQIDYILGSTGRSYVVGYGKNFPKRPHHPASSCPDLPQLCDWHQYNTTAPNSQILYGALVSGPNIYDYFIDRREEPYFEYSVASLDFNVGFQNCLAALIHLGKQEDDIQETTSLIYNKTEAASGVKIS